LSRDTPLLQRLFSETKLRMGAIVPPVACAALLVLAKLSSVAGTMKI
jgi:hypothetical protein